MLKILKLIIPVADCGNNKLSLNLTEHVKDVAGKLITDLLLIKKDFDLMEEYFHDRLDTVIADKKKVLNKPPVLVHSEKKTEIEEHTTGPSSEVNTYTLEQILCEIVLVDFLKVYDELSYAINERIDKIFKKFKRIEKEVNILVEWGMLNFENIINNVNETVEYKDLFYFLNKLEEKLKSNFNISITDVRNILYGCNSNGVESRPEQIQEYYRFILCYERMWSPHDTNIAKFINFYSFSDKKFISQEEAMINYIHNFNKNLPHLYEYHKTIPKAFSVSKTRFSIYEKLLEKHKEYEKIIPFDFDKEARKLFSSQDIQLQFGINTALRRVIFEHLNYKHENYNDYCAKLEEIKGFYQNLRR